MDGAVKPHPGTDPPALAPSVVIERGEAARRPASLPSGARGPGRAPWSLRRWPRARRVSRPAVARLLRSRWLTQSRPGTATACPSRDFPLLVDLPSAGAASLEAFVTETIGLGDVEAAFAAMRRGDVLRSSWSYCDAHASATRVTSGTFSPGRPAPWRSTTTSGYRRRRECLVLDAPHDAGRHRPAWSATAGCSGSSAPTPTTTTSGCCPRGRRPADAPVWLHPGDLELWALTYPGPSSPVADLPTNCASTSAGTASGVHTPGHSPGSSTSRSPTWASLFSGDTLFAGGPGATGRSSRIFRPS